MSPVPVYQPYRRLLIKASLPACLGVGLLPGCGGGSTPAGVADRRIAVAPGVSLQVREWQAGSAALTYVLLAGLGGNARCFDSLAPALAERAQARVVAVSRRGYGQSDKPLPSVTGQGYGPATLVADLRALLDVMAIDRAVLVGHSIASNELTLFAGLHPHRTRGLVYLDTTYDYSRPAPQEWGGEPIPSNPALEDPVPGAADLVSLPAAIAFAKRTNKNWSAPLEAQLRDALLSRADGSVGFNTPDEVAAAMAAPGQSFAPDYRAVHAPALVVAAYPSTLRDLFPWLTERTDVRTLADAMAVLKLLREARAIDEGLLVRALPGSTVLRLQDSSHADFFIEHEAAVLRALEAMRW